MLKHFVVLSIMAFATLPVLNVSTLAADNKDLKINSKPTKDIAAIIRSLKDKDPQKPDSLTLIKHYDNTMKAESGDLTTKIDFEAKKITLKNKQKGEVTLLLQTDSKTSNANLEDNKVVYTGQDSKFDSIVEAVDGGVRQVISINSKDAPSFYNFPVELKNGSYLELGKSGEAYVKNKNGEVLLTVAMSTSQFPRHFVLF
jgi:hypothetical protein